MAELAVSTDPHEELIALGLGSCVGVVMLERQAGVAGLAHIVLPASGEAAAPVGKFADIAVPELISKMLTAGADRGRLQVAIAGGASMFEDTRRMNVGERNVTAVLRALRGARLRCEAADTGGTLSRTLRVCVGSGQTTVRTPTGARTQLFGPDEPAHRDAHPDRRSAA